MSVCPQCKNLNPDGAVFCDNCGASLAGVAVPQPAVPAAAPAARPAGAVCPSCGAAVIPGEVFCDACGASLPAAPVAQPVQPTPAPAQPVAQPAAAPAAPVAGGAVKCPICGASQPAGQAFCDACGASLAAAAPPVPPPVTPPPPPAIHPRLIVAGTGTQFDLSGKVEFLMGREDPVSGVFPEVDLTPHGGTEGGVSRRHAKLKVQGNQWLIEDLNSTNFTFVNNQKVNPGVPQPLKDGDQVRLGRVILTFHMA